MQVMSVTGPVDAGELGPTLVHEHIVVGMPGQELDPTQGPDRREIVAIAVNKLEERDAIRSFISSSPAQVSRYRIADASTDWS